MADNLYQLTVGSILGEESPEFVDDRLSVTNTPIFQILLLIYYIPLTWRKWLLDICRVQVSPLINTSLRLFIFQEPSIHYYHTPRGSYRISKMELARFMDNLHDSSVDLSLVSYFARAEGFNDRTEATNVIRDQIDKEFMAAVLYPVGQTQMNNYDWIEPSGDFQTSTEAKFNRGLYRLRKQFSIHHKTLIMPYRTDLKNVGYRCQSMLREAKSEGNSSDLMDSTTGDLLRHYYKTGIQVQGPLEVRLRWDYGILKPRVYYSLGGSSYWPGLYIQPIANALNEILQVTDPATRFDVSRLRDVSPEEILVTYDYTSFTTCLAELKFFLHWLGISLRGITMDVLDVNTGVEAIDIGDYILAYNQACNIHQEFDMSRIFGNDEEFTCYRQGRSGSLGTQGNIAFSTLNHGVHLSTFTQTPDEDSCVGDDALLVIQQVLFPTFCEYVRSLGHINDSKFSSIPFPETPADSQRHAFKYLKRPLAVDFMGYIRTGTLDSFPNIAPVLGLLSEFRSAHSFTSNMDEASTFSMQIGRFLANLDQDPVGLSYASEDALNLILRIFQIAYKRSGLNIHGGFPGSYTVGLKDNARVHFFYPAVDSTNIFGSNWFNDLYLQYFNEEITIPTRSPVDIPPEFGLLPGSTFVATLSHPLVHLLADLGCVRTRTLKRSVPFTESLKIELEEVIYYGRNDKLGKVMAEVTVVEKPSWYDEACLWYLDDHAVGMSEESASDILSMFTYASA